MGGPRIPVNRFYPVNPQDDSGATFDVVFFPGLQIRGGKAAQEAYRTTWTNKDGVVWPKEWLPDDLENIRVFSLSYDAEATKWFGQGNTEDVEYIGENLFQSLVMGSERVGCRPFVLVGHSFGGLVIKSLINETKRRFLGAETNPLDKKVIGKAKEFLKNLKGIVFYAVPHSGADAATLLSYFRFVGLSKIIGNLTPFGRRMAKMSVMTQATVYNWGINIFAFGEGKPTYLNKMVVESASAMQFIGNNFYMLEDCDHMQVCKPPNRSHPSYSMLLQFLRNCSKDLDTPKLSHELITQAATEKQNGTITERLMHEMKESVRLNWHSKEHEPNCGASASKTLPLIWQQQGEKALGKTTDFGMANIKSEQVDIELEACLQQESIGKQCENEVAKTQEEKLLSSIHQRLQHVKRTIGVIPTPTDYLESHSVHHDSERIITFGWRVTSQQNALELFFRSIEGMSHIVGVGFKFAKVLVVPTSLEVEIINIGQAKWDAIWQNSSNNKHHSLNVVSIVGVGEEGEKHENTKYIECLTAEQSAIKYGVGLLHQSHAAHALSIDAESKNDYLCMLNVVVEYLLLQQVMAAIMDKQCDGDGKTDSTCGGGNGTKQDIGGASTSQSIESLSWILSSLPGWKNSTGDDDDNDGTLPPRKRPHKVNHQITTRNLYRVTVRPGPGGSFDPKHIPQELSNVLIDPILEFEFNYKLDMKGVIYDKQIQITTTTSFDLGRAAPTETMNDSFGWYQVPIILSLKNIGVAKLDLAKSKLEETFKEIKEGAKTIHTHSDNNTLQRGVEGQGGFKTFFQLKLNANKTTSHGKMIAKEKASENYVLDVLKGFQYRDLSEIASSSLSYRFYSRPLTTKFLEDFDERFKYLSTGMCEAIKPKFIGNWLVTPEDKDMLSTYKFEAKRTLNRLYKVGEVSELEAFVQCYNVEMYVNHAMSHLYTLKDDYVLHEQEVLRDVLEVGRVQIG